MLAEQTVRGFRCFGRAWVKFEEFAPHGTVIVEAFRGSIEDEVDTLAVVAVEAGVVQEVTELGSFGLIRVQSALGLI